MKLWVARFVWQLGITDHVYDNIHFELIKKYLEKMANMRILHFNMVQTLLTQFLDIGILGDFILIVIVLYGS